MPKKPKRRRRFTDQLTQMQNMFLKSGFYFGRNPFRLDSEAKAAWEFHREDILAEHIRDHPGTRPWGWWEFESTEPRLQIRDGPEAVGDRFYLGKPSGFTDVPPDGMFESELAYLTRLELLTESELRLIERKEM